MEKCCIIFSYLYYFTQKTKGKRGGFLVGHLLLDLYQMSRLIFMNFFFKSSLLPFAADGLFTREEQGRGTRIHINPFCD